MIRNPRKKIVLGQPRCLRSYLYLKVGKYATNAEKYATVRGPPVFFFKTLLSLRKALSLTPPPKNKFRDNNESAALR